MRGTSLSPAFKRAKSSMRKIRKYYQRPGNVSKFLVQPIMVYILRKVRKCLERLEETEKSPSNPVTIMASLPFSSDIRIPKMDPYNYIEIIFIQKKKA